MQKSISEAVIIMMKCFATHHASRASVCRMSM
jgi:hypothetical protein